MPNLCVAVATVAYEEDINLKSMNVRGGKREYIREETREKARVLDIDCRVISQNETASDIED